MRARLFDKSDCSDSLIACTGKRSICNSGFLHVKPMQVLKLGYVLSSNPVARQPKNLSFFFVVVVVLKWMAS